WAARFGADQVRSMSWPVQPPAEASVWLTVQPALVVAVPVLDGSVDWPHWSVASGGHVIVHGGVQFVIVVGFVQPGPNDEATRWTAGSPPGPFAPSAPTLLHVWFAPHL